MIKHYILKDKVPVEVSALEWSEWFDKHRFDRQVKYSRVGLLEVITSFIGYSINGQGVFETMVFENYPSSVGGVRRTWTWEAAEKAHDGTVAEYTGVQLS